MSNNTANSSIFVGRQAEIARLIEFCQGIETASSLRITTLVGDAGIGKSALIGQLMLRLQAQNTTIIHAKIYPDSAYSPLLVLEQSLRESAALSKLLGNPSAAASLLVPSSLRRIARLRKSVVILEDTHLLQQEAMEEFSTILTAIADESISMILATRPGNNPANAVAARWAVEQLPLLGLQASEVQEYLEQSFDPKVRQEAAQILHQTTLGNPLAIQGAVRQLQQRQKGQITGQNSTIEHYGKLSVESVAEGFLSRLNESERKAAARIAVLGEIFSKEAAEMVIENSAQWIHRLQQLGILSRSNVNSSPIVGTPITAPFAFTHTLVHQHLLGSAMVESDALCRILQQAVPLYTATALRYLAASPSSSLGLSILESLFDYAIHQAEEIAYGSRWPIASDWYNVAEFCLNNMQRCGADILEPTINLLLTKVYIARPDENVTPALDTVMELTSDVTSIEIAKYRLMLFEHCFHWGWGTENPDTHSILWDEATAIIEAYPSFRYSHEYVGVLFGYKQYVQHCIPNYTFRRDLSERVKIVSDIAQSLLFDEKSKVHFTIYEQITLANLTFFSTKENDFTSLFFDWVEQIAPTIEPNSIIQKEYDQLIASYYIEKLGYILKAIAPANRSLRLYEETGRLRAAATMRVQLLFVQLLLGRSINEVLDEYNLLIGHSKFWTSRSSTECWRDELISGLILRGAIKEAALLAQNCELSLTKLISAYLSGDIQWVLHSVENGQVKSKMANFIYYSYKNELLGNILCIQQVSEVFKIKTNRYLHIMIIMCIVDTVQFIQKNQNQHYEMVISELGDIHAVLTQCLRYFEERQLGACITPFINRYEAWFPQKEVKYWRSTAEDLMRIIQKEFPFSSDQKIRISMLGTISVTLSGQPAHRPQGDRIRSTLGLMVANEIFQHKLSTTEFDEIATGISNDPEHARANMRVIIDRIRKMVGRDAVITETGKPPRLNKEFISVDLLEAVEKINIATSALHKQRYSAAFDSLLAALKIIGTEVPYPTLYDSFFESARQEFEYMVRTAVLSVSRAFMDSGDDNTAVVLLQQAVQFLRGDEEVAELACTALERAGKFIEAERLKRDYRLSLA